MTIDKQALRKAAEKATPGPWEMEQENIWFTDADGYTKHLMYAQQGDGVDDKQDHYNTAFIAAANPATVLTLLDDLVAAEKRIAELERSETQLIDERDNAESALNDAYKAVMGQAPEWSNWFSFANAIDEIELACEQWRNQTDDVIQFRQRIADLEAREVMLPDRKSEIFWPGDAAEFDSLGYVIAVKSAIRVAGIKVKG